MVWAHQPSYLGIFNQQYYAAISRASQNQFKIYVERHTHTNFRKLKTNLNLGQQSKGSYSII